MGVSCLSLRTWMILLNNFQRDMDQLVNSNLRKKALTIINKLDIFNGFKKQLPL